MGPPGNRQKTAALCLVFPAAAGIDELLAGSLFELGAAGMAVTAEEFQVFFPPDSPAGAIRERVKAQWEALRRAGMPLPPFRMVIRQVPQRDWQKAWMEHFHAVTVGEKLVVAPPWETVEERPGRILVRIYPGRAFGTGTHETTQLMLEALADEWRPGMDVLDVGTGTGILAVAAAKMGAHRVFAFDADPAAVVAARENARRNRVSRKIFLWAADSPATVRRHTAFHLVLANILSGVLLPMLPELVHVLRPGGRLVLSGILAEEETKMRAALNELPVEVVRVPGRGEWIGMICQKRGK